MLVPELGAYNGNIDNPQYQCWSKPVTWGVTNIVRKSDSNYRMWLWMKIMQVQQLSRKQLTSGDPACHCCFFVRNSGLVTLHEIISHKTVSDLPFIFIYGNGSIDYTKMITYTKTSMPDSVCTITPDKNIGDRCGQLVVWTQTWWQASPFQLTWLQPSGWRES